VSLVLMSASERETVKKRSKAMDTLDDTFARYFGNDDEPEPQECTDCGKAYGLTVLYTKENGNQVWICASCRIKRENEARERHEREAARVARMAARDEWEQA